jgi:hypothetical protein
MVIHHQEEWTPNQGFHTVSTVESHLTHVHVPTAEDRHAALRLGHRSKSSALTEELGDLKAHRPDLGTMNGRTIE